MRITDIRLGKLAIPLKKPFKTALRVAKEVVTNIVVVETDASLAGYGEAPPTAVITGDTDGSIAGAIGERIKPLLVGRDMDDFDDIMTTLGNSLVHNGSAKAAVDIALYDLRAKQFGMPLYRLLGGDGRAISTDYTISVNEPDEMVRDSMEAVAEGYDALKIKVGTDLRKDMERLTAIRDAVGERILLRADANQGWTVKEAVRAIRFMEDKGLGIELVEQPVKGYDFDGLKTVTDSVETLILADEAVFSARDAMTILSMRAADLINIKLMKTGGIHQALKICAMAETAGVECMIGAMMESKVSVTAACHLASAKRIFTRYDMDPPILCSADPVTGGATYERSTITLPDAPGLGITAVEGVRFVS